MFSTSFAKNIAIALVIVLTVFAIGFMVSSGIFYDSGLAAIGKISAELRIYVINHCNTLWVHSWQKSKWHFFLLPEGGYNAAFYQAPLSPPVVITIIANSLFNALFQPLFLCALTPQAIFNCLLFPFFIYGVIKYFKKVPLMIIIWLAFYIYTGIYGSVVEAIVRHRMSCELIYLLIGLAGFVSLTTER